MIAILQQQIIGNYSSKSKFNRADGFYAYLNCYDMIVYSIGKGPSAITVDSPLSGVKLGDSITIRGTITDISAGASKRNKQHASLKVFQQYLTLVKQVGWNTFTCRSHAQWIQPEF